MRWKTVYSYRSSFPINATGCDCCGLWKWVAMSFSKSCSYTVQTNKNYSMSYYLMTYYTYLRPHALAQEVSFFFLYEGYSHSLFLPSGKVLLLMAVYSTARAWIFTGRTKCHRTSTSHKYLFSTFLPASAFIYWLFGNFVCLSGNRRQVEHGE